MSEERTNRSGLAAPMVLVLLGSFGVLLWCGVRIFEGKPPIPATVVAPDGSTVTTLDEIQHGQQVFLNNQLMDYGTILGHGAYYGPDFTALAIRELGVAYKAGTASSEEVIETFKTNGFDPAADSLRLSADQVEGLRHLKSFFGEQIATVWPKEGVHLQASPEEIDHMISFIWWTAWAATTRRPGADHTYTNNWPYDPVAGNTLSSDALVWSAMSVGVLVLGIALITLLYFRGGFQPVEAAGDARGLSEWAPTSSQHKSFKYFLLAGVLFLVQVMLGAYMAHAYVEPSGFYGIDLTEWLPFNLARGLHLQLAIFWIALCFLGMGIFIAPMVGGSEPKAQGVLVDVLFGAVVLVAVGSMTGEVFRVWGLLPESLHFLGSDGWEYMELGYVWRVLLFGGLLIWASLLIRGIWPRLAQEGSRTGLVHLLAYAATAMGLAYGASLLFDARSHVSLAEYWRWWVIHLWVEGTFEVFAIVIMGLMFVSMGLLEVRNLARALQFQIIILMGSGIIGTGHHLYFTGSPAFMIALASCFSALEVVPLCLLCVEAWDQYKTMSEQGETFVYRPVFWCLISVGLWNLYGAGVLGFLINQPAVSYFEMGTWFTAAHGHGALMGVYGMLAISMILFCTQTLAKDSIRQYLGTLRHAFWGLNIGLFTMVTFIIVPIGYLQLQAAVDHGFWFARTREFYETGLVNQILWARLIPDVIFIYGVLALVTFLFRAWARVQESKPVHNPKSREIPERFVPPPVTAP